MTRRKAARREAALQRAELVVNLTPEQKLARIDQRLGKDVGAKKERAKLVALIAQKNAPKKEEVIVVQPEVSAEVVEKPKKKAKQRRTEDKNLRHKTKE